MPLNEVAAWAGLIAAIAYGLVFVIAGILIYHRWLR